jgi:hypothetical protein
MDWWLILTILHDAVLTVYVISSVEYDGKIVNNAEYVRNWGTVFFDCVKVLSPYSPRETAGKHEKL